LEKSKEPVKTFIQNEIAQSYNAVKEAKLAHSQSPSRYTAGFVELAKGSHAENEEMFKRLAQAVGVAFDSLQLDQESREGDDKATTEVKRPPNSRKITPREVSIDCAPINRSLELTMLALPSQSVCKQIQGVGKERLGNRCTIAQSVPGFTL
jgi:hypothetical protein